MSTFSKIKDVAQRELKTMFSRPLYLIATVVVLVVCSFFFLSIMQQGVPERMPIGVVDLDKSTTSRNVIRQLNSMQLVEVKMVYNSYADARQQVQTGDIYGFLLIPHGFSDDMLSFKRPTLSFYTNNAYTVGAGMAYKQMLTMCNLVSAGFHLAILSAKGMTNDIAMKIVQPIAIESHQIANPTSNYSIYLLGTMIPGVLGLIVLMTTIFSIGIELKDRTAPEWMEMSEGSFAIAIIGKMLPYTILYFILGLSCNVLMFQIMHFPIAGSYINISIGLFLFVAVMQAMGIVIIGAAPVLRTALSVGALYGMLGFSMSGFTFPSMAMLPPFRSLAWLFPLRHYYMIYVNEGLLGGPEVNTFIPIAAMIAFFIGPFIVSRRLKYAAINLNYAPK